MSKLTNAFRKPAPVYPDELEIDRKLRSLDAHRSAVVAEILARERAGDKRSTAPTAVTEQARALQYLGDEVPAQGKTLDELFDDLAAINRAIEIGCARLRLERSRLADRLATEAAPAWAEIVGRRIAAIAALQRANSEAENFVVELTRRAGAQVSMPMDWTPAMLLGTQTDGGEGAQFITEAAAVGFKAASR